MTMWEPLAARSGPARRRILRVGVCIQRLSDPVSGAGVSQGTKGSRRGSIMSAWTRWSVAQRKVDSTLSPVQLQGRVSAHPRRASRAGLRSTNRADLVDHQAP
jgi:hypothetical protein